MGEGEVTRFSETRPRKRLWTIKWGTSQLEYTTESDFGGTFENVSGTMYENDKPVNTFKADTATVDKATMKLGLKGHVTITSLDLKSTLRCDEVVGSSETNVVKALGNVTVESDDYIFSGGDEIWASSDLKKVSTPDMFNKP